MGWMDDTRYQMERLKRCLRCRRPWPWASLPWASPHRTVITEPAPAAASQQQQPGSSGVTGIKLGFYTVIVGWREQRPAATSRAVWKYGLVLITQWATRNDSYTLDANSSRWQLYTSTVYTMIIHNNKSCSCCSTLIIPVVWDAEPMTFVWCWPLSQKWDKHIFIFSVSYAVNK